MAKLIFDSDPLVNLDYADSLDAALDAFHIPALESIDSLDYSRDIVSEDLNKAFKEQSWPTGTNGLMSDGSMAGGAGGMPLGAAAGGGGMPLDLNTLLRVLDEHSKSKDKQDGSYNSWQLVMIQGLLLTILVAVSIAWACCCKRKCFHTRSSTPPPPSVAAALRKLSSSGSLKSRDFPPSYSTMDLHTLALSVQDYLYPPPTYPEINSRMPDDLAYLDLEGSHRQLARLSFSGSHAPAFPGYSTGTGGSNSSSGSGGSSVLATPRSISRQPSSMSSSTSESRKSSYSQDSASSASSRKTSIIKDSSRKSSRSQDSRRSSRVSFSESVECSNGSYRRLSGSGGGGGGGVVSPVQHESAQLRANSSQASLTSLTSLTSVSSAESSRRSSASSTSSASTSGLSRKLGLSQEALDKELRRKLEAIELAEMEEEEEEQQEKQGEVMVATIRSVEQPQESRGSNLQTVIEIEKY